MQIKLIYLHVCVDLHLLSGYNELVNEGHCFTNDQRLQDLSITICRMFN